MNDIYRVLDDYTTLNLAYVDETGEPQACAVFFARGANRSLIFVSARATRHARALAADRRVAFTAQAEGQDWPTITGIQGRGTCVALSGIELAAARSAYARRFPFVADDPKLGPALAEAEHWALTPRWLRLIDNSKGFGHKSEWTGADRPTA